MKTMMKKTAAYLLALLLVIQMVPAFADTIYSESYTQDNINYRDAIEITPAMDADILKVGMTNQLSVQDGYTKISWVSDHPEIATVDSTGLVEAVGPGKVTITVISEGQYKDTISFKVVADTKAEEPKTDPAAQGEESGNNQGEAQAQDEKIIIFIKGINFGIFSMKFFSYLEFFDVVISVYSSCEIVKAVFVEKYWI